MTLQLTTAHVRGVLLDIEGTTTPISFVHEVLFSYARAALKDYLTAHWNSTETVADIARLRNEHASDVDRQLNPPILVQGTVDDEIDSVVAYLNWLIDRDRKSTALKSLQGKIWRQGYLDGTLKAELFNDVPAALERWRNAGLSINIFSSGSELAQRLLFAHTQAGDFTGLIDSYFDTKVGRKTDAESYRRIAASLLLPAQSIVFISDVVAELDAASLAGMDTVLCLRPGNAPQSGGEQHERVHTLTGLLI
ncbi:MAG: acireductone synthase [Pyrinomonadaceae bacterium]|nr:acireductone synthase [Pyrinomonadaceae bacterium]